MGDASNIVSYRMEAPCQEKDLAHKDLKKNLEKNEYTLEKPAGDPGETKCRITENILETNDDSNEQTAASESLLEEPETPQFSDTDTKLRPDAPPFVPECKALISEIAYGETEITTDSSFVNVDLRLALPEDQEFPEAEYPAIPKMQKEIMDQKDPGLKPFSLTSTPRVKKSQPKIEVMPVEEEEMINVAVTGPQTATTLQLTRHRRIFSVNFLLGNRTQIAVIVASLVICIILITYVLIR